MQRCVYLFHNQKRRTWGGDHSKRSTNIFRNNNIVSFSLTYTESLGCGVSWCITCVYYYIYARGPHALEKVHVVLSPAFHYVHVYLRCVQPSRQPWSDVGTVPLHRERYPTLRTTPAASCTVRVARWLLQ